MYSIKVNQIKNLLTLRLEGSVSDDELKKGTEEMMQEVNKLRHGFVVINDIANMKPVSQEGTEYIKKAQIYIVQKGVSRIIRVTNNPISKMQFTRTAKSAGYIAENVSSVEEAMDMAFDTQKVR